MSRLPACTPAEVERALRRAGFYLDHSRGSYRYYRHRPVIVSVAFHAKTLKRGTLMSIVKQAGLTVDEFHKTPLSERCALALRDPVRLFVPNNRTSPPVRLAALRPTEPALRGLSFSFPDPSAEFFDPIPRRSCYWQNGHEP